MPEHGLADILREGVDAEFHRKIQASLLPTPQPNLFLMPKGGYDESATEAAYRAPMAAFVGAAKASFDVVILDSAPVIVTSDPLGMAPLSRGVLYVVRSGVVSTRESTRALEPFRDREIPLAVVVNGIRRSPADENYFHKYGYYYQVADAEKRPAAQAPGRITRQGKPDPREVPINT
jgi:Mrp family chromosome partitioning ATPase